MKYKFIVGEIVLVYKNQLRPSGAIGVVTARDALETNYCVQELGVDPDLAHDFWAKEEDLGKLNFNKPVNLFTKLKTLCKRR